MVASKIADESFFSYELAEDTANDSLVLDVCFGIDGPEGCRIIWPHLVEQGHDQISCIRGVRLFPKGHFPRHALIITA